MVNRVDVETVITTDGNSDPLDTSGMGQVSFTAVISSISGSGAYVQIEIQASDTGGNDSSEWNNVHSTRRILADGVQRISGIRISSKYYRFRWFVGGSSPSANIKITSTLKDYSPIRTGSLFRYDDLDLKTGSAVSTTYSTFSNTEVGCMLIRGADSSTVATVKIQGSQDGLNFHDHTGDFNIIAGQTINKDFSGSSHRFFKVIVVTAATDGTSAPCTVLWNSTGGA